MEGQYFRLTCKRKSRRLVDGIWQLVETGCPGCLHTAVLMAITMVMKKSTPFLKIICWLLLIANLCVLTSYILFKESPGSVIHVRKTNFRKHGPRFDQKNLQLFATIHRISNSHMNDRYKYWNIGGNILGFVPLGFLLSVLLFRNGRIFKTILAVFLVSLFFETIQLYTGLGVFDVDDLFLNTLGGLFGSLLSLFVPRSLKTGYRHLPAPDL